MKRRTFISLMSVMAAAGVLTLAGCSSNSGSSAAASGAASSAASTGAADQLAAIQTNGKLVVALEGAWQPWSYHDESDTLVGYDVEVSRAIAEKLDVEPEYVESDWDSLFAGLDAGRFDIVCNGVEVTDERAKTYDFTEPYGYIHTALAVRKDNDEITSFEDLKGKTTANSLASTYMELAESYGATVQGIDTLEETIQLLTAGRIDATLNADVSFYDYLNVHPDADFKIVAQTEEASHVAIPLRKADASATLLEAPWAYNSEEDVQAMCESDIGKGIMQDFEDAGFKVLWYQLRGPRELTSNVPINKASDLQGRKMRMSGNVLHNSMWTAAGAITSAIALSETFNALSQGVVEMQENPYDMIYDNSFYEVQKYVNQTNHVYSTIFNLLSVDIWNGLSEDQQNIITETSNEMQDWTNEYYFAHKDEYLEKLKETGMQVNEDVDRDDIKNAMMPAIEEFLKSQPGDLWTTYQAIYDLSNS